MKPPQFEPDVGSSLSLRVIVASVVALLLIVGGFFGYRWLDSEKRHGEVIIATGPQSGTYQLLGLAFARVLESSGAVESAEVIETEGSVANMRLIGAPTDGADLAVVQGDTPPNEHVRLVAPLFEEVLHILVAKEAAEEITSIADLRGRTVSLGEEASGTRLLAERVLDHFRVRVGEDVRLSPQEASQALVDGKVEVAFILSAIPSRLIDDLAQMDAVRFLSLGDAEEHGTEAEALALAFSGLKGTTIPRSTYVRLPERPVRSIAVEALLVASRDVEVELVRRVTTTLFENRMGVGGLAGEELVVASRIREAYRPSRAIYPYHRGAAAYFERANPPFLVEYAEVISLGLTLLVGLYSASIALRGWMRRRMKNRIDAYYLEVQRQKTNLGDLSLAELLERRDALDEVRQRAFSDLVSERLTADQSFTIFQDYLRSELSSIEARILERSQGLPTDKS